MNFLLHHLMEESAKKFPQQKAVVCKDHSISYQELDQLSNKIANILHENGLNREYDSPQHNRPFRVFSESLEGILLEGKSLFHTDRLHEA